MVKLSFNSRDEFRNWLMENALSNQGVWIEFNKSKSSNTLKANEALEEALCFGWIDGQVKSIDDKTYIKYFKQRSSNSIWSEKNKKLVEELEKKNLMTDYGRKKVEIAKKNGNWDKSTSDVLTDEHVRIFKEMLISYEEEYQNFQRMSKSIQNTYMKSYFFCAKTEEGKKKRFNDILLRLKLNLNPMESLKGKI